MVATGSHVSMTLSFPGVYVWWPSAGNHASASSSVAPGYPRAILMYTALGDGRVDPLEHPNMQLEVVRKYCYGRERLYPNGPFHPFVFLLACLLVCLLACLPACLLACLPACLLVCLLACLPACLRACLSACLLAGTKQEPTRSQPGNQPGTIQEQYRNQTPTREPSRKEPTSQPSLLLLVLPPSPSYRNYFKLTLNRKSEAK